MNDLGIKSYCHIIPTPAKFTGLYHIILPTIVNENTLC